MSVAQGKESAAGGAPAGEKKTAEPVVESSVPDTPRRFRRRHGAAPADEREAPRPEAGTRAPEVTGDADQLDDREGNGRQHHLGRGSRSSRPSWRGCASSRPDLTKFSETELAVMASEAAGASCARRCTPSRRPPRKPREDRGGRGRGEDDSRLGAAGRGPVAALRLAGLEPHAGSGQDRRRDDPQGGRDGGRRQAEGRRAYPQLSRQGGVPHPG